MLFARYRVVGNLHQESYELLGMIILCSSWFFFLNCSLWVVFDVRSSNV